MQQNEIPRKFPIPFASGAGSSYIRAIPTNHVTPTTSDAPASLVDGFPPETFTPLESGGVPPSGADINGILNQISAWARWFAAGGAVVYDPDFQAAIGGYPKNARVHSATVSPRVWICTADNNMSNPDSGGEGWVSDVAMSYQDFTSAGSGTVTVPTWSSHAEVSVVGGGAGGAGGNATRAGGGGGAGGYATGVIAVTPGATMPYSVGAGGSGGGTNGGNGGASSFAGMTATGGLGGVTSSGGGGGSASGAPRNFVGGTGGDGNPSSSTYAGGNGAPGPFGGGGRAGNPLGVSGQASGAGGGGGWGASTSTGGAGAPGAVLIRWLP
jgi:hypothetical protein